MKKFALFLAMAVFVFTAAAQEKRFTVPLEDSPSLGPAGAPVTLIEFIDFQ